MKLKVCDFHDLVKFAPFATLAKFGQIVSSKQYKGDIEQNH